VLKNVFAVSAIRTVVDKPRQVNTEEPNNDEGDDRYSDVFLAIHLNA
jgi:hypothetical protein